MMGTTSRFVGSALLLALLAPGAQAQDGEAAAAPLVGSRIRFSAEGLSGPPVQGRILAEDGDAWTIEVDGRMPLRVQRDAIRELEVSTGRPRQWRKGLLVGAAVGAAMFAILGDDTPECRDEGQCYTRGQMAGVGVFGGAVWGLGIGSLVRSDQWSRISPDRVRVTVQPAPGRGLRAALSIGF
jgi:hypothetical protein